MLKSVRYGLSFAKKPTFNFFNFFNGKKSRLEH